MSDSVVPEARLAGFSGRHRFALVPPAVLAVLILLFALVVSLWRTSRFTPRLLLIGVVFGGLIVAVVSLATKWIRSIESRKLPDAMSRTEALVVGTVLVVIVLAGGMVEMAAISGSATGGFHAACIGLHQPRR